MLRPIIAALLVMVITPFATAGGVTFTNKTGSTLSCSKQVGSDFLSFIKLNDNEVKTFDGFSVPTKVRCSTDISSKSDRPSSTLLTHFTVDTEGEYTAMLQLIECDDGCGKGWRTIIVMPNGEPYFTRYKHLQNGGSDQSQSKRLKGGGSAQIQWEDQ